MWHNLQTKMQILKNDEWGVEWGVMPIKIKEIHLLVCLKYVGILATSVMEKKCFITVRKYICAFPFHVCHHVFVCPISCIVASLL